MSFDYVDSIFSFVVHHELLKHQTSLNIYGLRFVSLQYFHNMLNIWYYNIIAFLWQDDFLYLMEVYESIIFLPKLVDFWHIIYSWQSKWSHLLRTKTISSHTLLIFMACNDLHAMSNYVNVLISAFVKDCFTMLKCIYFNSDCWMVSLKTYATLFTWFSSLVFGLFGVTEMLEFLNIKRTLFITF